MRAATGRRARQGKAKGLPTGRKSHDPQLWPALPEFFPSSNAIIRFQKSAFTPPHVCGCASRSRASGCLRAYGPASSGAKIMGARPSTPEVAREPPQREQQQEEEDKSEHESPEHDQSSPTLVQLPEELLCAICARLELASLSAVASTCHELARGIPDAVWLSHLRCLKHAGDGAIEDTSRCGQRITNSVQRQAAVEAASEAAESAAFLVALSDLMGIKSARLQVGALRSLVCNLCLARPGSARETQPGGLEPRPVALLCGPACLCGSTPRPRPSSLLPLWQDTSRLYYRAAPLTRASNPAPSCVQFACRACSAACVVRVSAHSLPPPTAGATHRAASSLRRSIGEMRSSDCSCNHCSHRASP